MKSKEKNNVVVFFGGKSVEREVSVITGLQTANNLNSFLHEVFCVYIDENGTWFYGEELKDVAYFKNINKTKLKKVCLLPNSKFLFWVKGKKLKPLCEVDCIVNCCHGTFGEDGELSGVIKCSTIDMCSPDVLPSAVAMDKSVSKMFFKGLGLPCLDSFLASKNEFEKNFSSVFKQAKKIGFPLVVKPCSLGSSVGVGFCENEKQLKEKMEVAFEFDFFVLVEKGLKNFDEFFCSCYGNILKVNVSEIERSKNNGELLSFDDKYLKNSQKEFPAKIGKELKAEIKDITKKIFCSLKCLGVIRVDFLFDKQNNKLFVNEANLIPGSLAYSFWKNKFDFGDFLEELLQLGKNHFALLKNSKTIYHSNILENFEQGSKTKLK